MTSPSSRIAVGIAALVAVLAAAGTMVALTRPAARNTTGLAHQQPSKLPSAQPPRPQVIALPDGTKITCPLGLAPEIMLEEAAFDPALAGGVSLEQGTYHVKLRGTIANETGEPIHLISVAVAVGDAKWDADTAVATSVPPHATVPLAIEGSYRSGRAQPADVHAHLTWEWQAPTLRPCGTSGLIEEH